VPERVLVDPQRNPIKEKAGDQKRMMKLLKRKRLPNEESLAEDENEEDLEDPKAAKTEKENPNKEKRNITRRRKITPDNQSTK
jgi:hypothetical protein